MTRRRLGMVWKVMHTYQGCVETKERHGSVLSDPRVPTPSRHNHALGSPAAHTGKLWFANFDRLDLEGDVKIKSVFSILISQYMVWD